MSVKQADLMRAWGLSRGRISQMVKKGMPLTSLAEAEAWRVAHYGGSAARHKQGKGDKSNSTQFGGRDLPPMPPPVNSEDLKREDITGTLARLKRNEMLAWEALAEAVDASDENKTLLGQKKFTEASTLRVKLEKDVAALLLQEGETVLMAEAKEYFTQHITAVQMILKNMPVKLAARCNPSDPQLAKQALNEAIEAVFKTLNQWDS